MARKRKKPRARKPAARGWLWMTAGFALGLVAAAALYLWQHLPGGAADTSAPAAGASTPAAQEPEREAATPVASSPVESREPSEPSEPANAAQRDEPRFEFYELLPEFEVVVPEVESGADPGPQPAEVEEPGRYVLQVGSFTTFADADRLQANLALLGIESRLQRVAIDDRVFHRVRVGPLSDLERVNEIRSQLSEARIDSLLMRAPNE